MPDFPHENLPLDQLSLSQFTYLMQQAFKSGDDLQYINTALCGRTTDEEGDWRISVNARQELHPPEYPRFTRDYDSAIGITKNLPFLTALYVFPVPSFKETLKKRNHVKAIIDDKHVPLHCIPNCGLGTVAHRHITRIFFPKLYDKTQQYPSLTQAHLTMLYDKCIRPAVFEVMAEQASHWPVSYQEAVRQAKDTRGHLHLGTLAVPPGNLVPFCNALRTNLDLIPEFKDTFFCHELRGLKGGTAHEEDDEGRNPGEAFNTFFDSIDMARIDDDNWMVDVGLELHDPKHVVHWSKSSHRAMLGYLLPSLSAEQVASLQRNKKAFHLDNAAHLDDFAGFRCEPGKRARDEDNIEYINVYTTDKCATYQLHKGIWRCRSCPDLLPNYLDKLLVDLDDMSRTYKACSGSDNHRSQDGSARLEIRVPLRKAERALCNVPRDMLQSWTFSIPERDWWHFKFFRLGAIYRALDLLNASPPALRLLPSSLTLGAILIYMLNALNYRPAEGLRETELTKVCCWNVQRDDADEHEAPDPILLRYGLYFISGVDLEDGATPRMGGTNTVSPECIGRLYDVLRLSDLSTAFRIKAMSEKANPRTRNRKKESQDVRVVARREELIAQDTPLADLGITVEPLPREHGGDIRAYFHNGTDQDDDYQRQQEGIDDVVTRIWRQFPFDLFENAPNHRFSHQGSHLMLSVQQRRDATIDIFRSIDLSQLFSRVVVKIVQPDKWKDLEFKRYFPGKNYVVPKNMQNFPRMRYYRDWNALMDSLSLKDAEIVRKSVWKTFKTFHWLPLTDADRLWNTKVVRPTAEWIHLPHNDKKPVVRVGLNGNLVLNPRVVKLYKEPVIVVVISDEEEGGDGTRDQEVEVIELD